MIESEFFELVNRSLSSEELALAAVPHMAELSYEDFVDLLYSEIQRHIEKLECDAEQLQGLDEDSITGNIIRMLNAGQNFKASAQTYQGGAVDLTVELKNHHWIAEAKKLTVNEKVFEGLLQLITRYVKRDDNAGLLIYVLNGKFAEKKKNWKTYLSSDGGWEGYVDVKKEVEYRSDLKELISGHKFTKEDAYCFDSEIMLDRGTSLKMRHFFCNFTNKPMDLSGTKAKKHRKNLGLEMLETMYDGSTSVNRVPLDIGEVEKALSLMFREVQR